MKGSVWCVKAENGWQLHDSHIRTWLCGQHRGTTLAWHGCEQCTPLSMTRDYLYVQESVKAPLYIVVLW